MEGHLYWQQLERRCVHAEAGVQGERDKPLRRLGPLYQGVVKDTGHDQAHSREDRACHPYQGEQQDTDQDSTSRQGLLSFNPYFLNISILGSGANYEVREGRSGS